MSWIQNFFRIFKKEKEERLEHFEKTKSSSSLPRQQNEYSKEFDVRITYQYPKGHFRFPIIPDEKRPTKHRKEQVNPKAQKTETKKIQPNVDKKSEQEKFTVKKEYTKREYTSSGPFRPTEIPSPVFGFSRPKKAVIEHELSHFTKDLFDQSKSADGKKEKAGKEEALGIQTELAGKTQGEEYISNQSGKTNQGAPFTSLQQEFKDQSVETEEKTEGEEVPGKETHNNESGLSKEQVTFDPYQQETMEQKEEIMEATGAAELKSEPGPDHLHLPNDDGFLYSLQQQIMELTEDTGVEPAAADEQEERSDKSNSTNEEAAMQKVEQETTAAEEELAPVPEESYDRDDFNSTNEEAGIHQVEQETVATEEELAPVPEESYDRDDFDSTNEEAAMQKVEQETAAAEEEPATAVVEDEFEQDDFNLTDEEAAIHQVQQETALTREETTGAITEQKNIHVSNRFTADVFSEQTDQEIKGQASASEAEANRAEENSDTDDTEPLQPKRSHLPFNVMMLKQDKQKWEERRKDPAAEHAGLLPQQADQTSIEAVSMDADKEETSCQTEQEPRTYEFPHFQLLNPSVSGDVDSEWLETQESLLNETLQNFNVGAKVVNVTQGPAVTRFEVQPEPGVKVNKVTNLSDDIKLSLAARDIRIEAPIPGKHTIGIEVPNQKSRPVFISEIIQSNVFHESASPLTAVLGLDISGKPIVTDLKKMPHGLIAGATGSGKSVCINTILVSLLYKAKPEELKLMLIDPKMVELAPYNRIPHLVSPVITDVKAATAALKWAVDEMERRYELFAHTGVRDINRFNELAVKHKRYSDKLPFIVIIIDELADLMMMSPADVEEAICRIAQKARACGIHLIIATQRPSVDVITGLIKANIPTRIAFSVSSQVDSRTIIDISGAEKLLGRGDMLFLENGSSKPVRLQGTFVSDEEIDTVVEHVREQQEPNYLFEQEELLKKTQISEEEDDLFYEACEFVVDQSAASTSSLQRRFKIGYNRAARLMDMMEKQGFISGANGSKPREVLITAADLESIQESSQ